MKCNIQSIGIDCVEVSRFSKYKNDKKHAFLQKVFFKKELDYCFSYKNPEVHLAGFFALKEAVSKALGVKEHPFSEIEVKHDKNGKPEAWNKRKQLNVNVSISHTNYIAIAIAVV